jgi:2,3-bisphosphoglycerate-dependent phosphoglycerate mutase
MKHQIQVTVIDELRERLVLKEITDGFYEIWCRSWDDFNFALPGCETSAEAQNRFVRAVKAIVDEYSQKPIAISTHGNVIGLFLNWVDNSTGRKEAEQLKNPDVVRVVRRDGVFAWDRNFRLRGLETIATDHRETPVDRDT